MKRIPFNLKYIITLSVSLILLAAAIVGPEVLFHIQDSYRMGKTFTGQRNSFDTEAISSSYGNLTARMSAFAEGLSRGMQYYVTETNYTVNEEFYELLEKTLNDELFIFCENWGFIPYHFFEAIQKLGYDVEAWKKYVLYDDFLEDGETTIVAMAWYVELVIMEEYRLKLLTDSENGIIYYVEWCYEGEISEKEKTNEMTLVDAEYTAIEDGMLYDFPVFANYYYEAKDMTDEEYEQIFNQIEKGNILELNYQLNYDGNNIEWEIGITPPSEENDSMVIYQGISDIAKWIPELQK